MKLFIVYNIIITFRINGNGISNQRTVDGKFRRRIAQPEEMLHVSTNSTPAPASLSPEHMPPPTRALTRIPSAPTSLKYVSLINSFSFYNYLNFTEFLFKLFLFTCFNLLTSLKYI